MRRPADHTGEVHNGREVLASALPATGRYWRRPRPGRKGCFVTQITRRWTVRCLSCGAVSTTQWQDVKANGCGPCKLRALRKDPVDLAVVRCRNGFVHGAKSRGYEWSLSDEQVRHLIFAPCHYCGTSGGNTCWRYDRTAPPVRYNGIDRMDNARGYVTGNVVPCCAPCNRAKGDLPYADFVEWLDRVARFRLAPERVAA